MPPTRKEISTELGFRSANSAEEHLRALARKGAIEISSGTARGIHLAEQISGAMQSIMALPLIGRVAAGSPILAEQNVDTLAPAAASPRTTAPSAITKPASTMVFMVAPCRYNTNTAVTNESGIATRLIMAVRHS